MLGLFWSLLFSLLKLVEFFSIIMDLLCTIFAEKKGHVLINESESQSKLTLDHASLVSSFDTRKKKKKEKLKKNQKWIAWGVSALAELE